GNGERRPIRLDQVNSLAAGFERLGRLRYAIEPQERNAEPARGRTHRADLTLAGGNGSAVFRLGAVIADRHRAAARDATMLDARNAFLTDLASLGPIHTPQP